MCLHVCVFLWYKAMLSIHTAKVVCVYGSIVRDRGRSSPDSSCTWVHLSTSMCKLDTTAVHTISLLLWPLSSLTVDNLTPSGWQFTRLKTTPPSCKQPHPLLIYSDFCFVLICWAQPRNNLGVYNLVGIAVYCFVRLVLSRKVWCMRWSSPTGPAETSWMWRRRGPISFPSSRTHDILTSTACCSVSEWVGGWSYHCLGKCCCVLV